MKRLAVCLILWLPMAYAQNSSPAAQEKFASGGTIRLHLEAGGYTVTADDSDNIVVFKNRDSVKVEIKTSGSNADVYVTDTPHNNFQATIQVPRRSNLWVRLTAGELVVENLEGDKNLEVRAGRIQVEIPQAQDYGHRDASVLAGSIEASPFDISKGGLFRSFDQQGPGKYRLHAHVMTGEIDLKGSD